MKQYNYKCIVTKNGSKIYYKKTKGKWKRISNKIGMKAERGKRKYKNGGEINILSVCSPYTKKVAVPRERRFEIRNTINMGEFYKGMGELMNEIRKNNEKVNIDIVDIDDVVNIEPEKIKEILDEYVNEKYIDKIENWQTDKNVSIVSHQKSWEDYVKNIKNKKYDIIWFAGCNAIIDDVEKDLLRILKDDGKVIFSEFGTGREKEFTELEWFDKSSYNPISEGLLKKMLKKINNFPMYIKNDAYSDKDMKKDKKEKQEKQKKQKKQEEQKEQKEQKKQEALLDEIFFINDKDNNKPTRLQLSSAPWKISKQIIDQIDSLDENGIKYLIDESFKIICDRYKEFKKGNVGTHVGLVYARKELPFKFLDEIWGKLVQLRNNEKNNIKKQKISNIIHYITNTKQYYWECVEEDGPILPNDWNDYPKYNSIRFAKNNKEGQEYLKRGRKK